MIRLPEDRELFRQLPGDDSEEFMTEESLSRRFDQQLRLALQRLPDKIEYSYVDNEDDYDETQRARKLAQSQAVGQTMQSDVAGVFKTMREWLDDVIQPGLYIGVFPRTILTLYQVNKRECQINYFFELNKTFPADVEKQLSRMFSDRHNVELMEHYGKTVLGSAVIALLHAALTYGSWLLLRWGMRIDSLFVGMVAALPLLYFGWRTLLCLSMWFCELITLPTKGNKRGYRVKLCNVVEEKLPKMWARLRFYQLWHQNALGSVPREMTDCQKKLETLYDEYRRAYTWLQQHGGAEEG